MDTRSPLEPKPELERGEPLKAPGKSKKASRKQGRKGLQVALKRLSTIQTVGIALAIAAMSVGTTYFALVKPHQPEPVFLPEIVSPQPTETATTPVITQTQKASPLKPVNEVVQWTYQTGELKALSKPVTMGRDVYASGNSTLYSISYEGDLRWQFAAPDKGKLTAPVVNVDNNMVVGTDTDYLGHVYSINGWGEMDWEFETPYGIRGKPAVTKHGFIVVGSRDLHCLYPRGGECWSFSVEGGYFNSVTPVMANNILVVNTNGSLYAVSYKGKLVWELDLKLSKGAIPTVGKDGAIYVYSYRTREMHCISPAGEVLWSNTITGNNEAGMTLMPDGSMLRACNRARITRFTPEGTVLWSIHNVVSGHDNPPLAGSDGLIYVSGMDSMLVLNPDGSKLVRVKIPGGTYDGLAQGIGGSIFASCGAKLLSLKLPE